MFSTHQLQFTLPHLQVSDRGEHTPYSIHSRWQKGREVQVSFHLTHSTNVGYLRTKLTGNLPTDVDVLECKKHSYIICYHCSLHTLTKATGLRDTSCQVKKYPLCTTKSLHALSPFLAHTSLSCLGTTINPTQGFKSSNSLLVPYHSLAFIALIRLHEIKSSG